MNNSGKFVPALAVTVALFASPPANSVVGPEILPKGAEKTGPYSYTGLLLNSEAQGSGVVARHPRIVLSAAHVVFDRARQFNPWLVDNRFYPARNKPFEPRKGGVRLAGLLHFAGYANTVFKYGGNSNRAFSQDVVALYAYKDVIRGGRFAPVWNDGAKTMANAPRSAKKLIVGYPSGLYARSRVAQDTLGYLMHRTGPYVGGRFVRAFGRHFDMSGVFSESGNSGGPLFIKTGRRFKVAGIYVAGFTGVAGIGVTGLDPHTWRVLVEKAIPDSRQPVITFDATNTPSKLRKLRLTGTVTDNQRVDSMRYRKRLQGGKWSKWKNLKPDLTTNGRRGRWSLNTNLGKKGQWEIQVEAYDLKHRPRKSTSIRRI